jgi:hypothetical protein
MYKNHGEPEENRYSWINRIHDGCLKHKHAVMRARTRSSRSMHIDRNDGDVWNVL